MPLYNEMKFGDISVSIWEITESADELLSLSKSNYAGEAAMLHGSRRKAEWLAVRLLLERMCGAEARIVYDAAGKPLLCGAQGYISISHTRGFALLAHSLRVPVGVDVELVGRNVVTVARRFVNEESRLSLPCGDINAGMLAYWCACEAIFKVVGDVGGTYKDNLFVKPFELSGHGRIAVSLKGLDTCCERDFFVDYINDGKLLVALCRE